MKRRGITLLELLVVMVLIGVMAGVSYPSIASGLDSLRLNMAADEVASFLQFAVTRAERRQQPVELSISLQEHTLQLRSIDPGLQRTYHLPAGLRVTAVHPLPPENRYEDPDEPRPPRRFYLMPGGTVPKLGVEIRAGRGAGRVVRLDPINAVPQIERVEAP